jgi:MFS family permease
MTAVAALTGIVPGITLVFGMVVVAGFFSMFFFPAMMGYIPEIVKKPQEVGPATGITTVMGFAGSLVAPWLFGRILDVGGRSAHSYLGGFLMLAAFPVAAVIGMLFFRRTTQ